MENSRWLTSSKVADFPFVIDKHLERGAKFHSCASARYYLENVMIREIQMALLYVHTLFFAVE